MHDNISRVTQFNLSLTDQLYFSRLTPQYVG